MFTQDTNGFGSLQFSNSITITNSIAGTIVTSSLTQSSLLANTAATFTVRFNTVNQISSTGVIVLNYPSQVTIATNAACLVTTTALFNDKCTIDNSLFTITVRNAFTGTFTG